MKEKVAKLINVKSLVTITLTAAFTYLSVTGTVSASQFVEIFLMVIGFYFGTQSKKEGATDENKQ
nr:hypothetical protein [Anaerosporobacter faecicola]